MKRIDISTIENSKIDEIRLKKFQEIKKNPILLKFFEENNIEDYEIMDNLSIFLRCINDIKNCENCKGKCSKDPKNMQFQIYFDTSSHQFSLQLEPCDYYKKIHLIQHRFYRMDFPIRWLDYDFINELEDNDYTKVRRLVLNKLVLNISGEKHENIYLYGESHLGKSFIMALYSKLYLEKNKGTVAFCSSRNLFQDLSDLNFQDKASLNEEMKNLMDVDILVLDGFGDEYKSEFQRDVFLLPLLFERKKLGKLTHFTSNFTISEIETMYTLSKASVPQVKQLVSFLKNSCTNISLDGVPYRL